MKLRFSINNIMKRAQFTLVMAMIFLAIGFAMMSGLYLFSNTIKDTSTRTVGNEIIETINGKLESTILELKHFNDSTVPVTISKTINIPEKIGDQSYSISGKNDTLRIQTSGKNTLTKTTNITNLWAINLEGFAHSSKGKVTLEFVSLDEKISIK